MKKRKLVVVFTLTLAGVLSVKAQDCAQNLSIFNEYAKVKNYKEAYTPWKKVYDNCPELHYATYVYGERILKDKLSNATEGEKSQWVQMLEDMYDAYHKHFPSKFSKGNLDIKKALLMYDEKIGSSEEIHALLDEAFKNHKEDFTDPKALYVYFSELVGLYEAGKKPLEDVFNTYDDVNEKIEVEKEDVSNNINSLIEKEEAGTLTSKEAQKLKFYRSNVDIYEKISDNIDLSLGKLADCENLVPLYSKNYEANKANEDWLRRAAGKMSDKDCTSDPLFEKLVTSLHNLKPSASSAYYLGVLNDKNGNNSKAIQYYNESVDLQTDNFKKSKILVQIARKYSKSAAVSYANKALKYNPSNTDAYKVIAHAYASSANECGNTQFEKRAIYWLAAQIARKAGLESLASRYEALAPSKADIFEAGMAGKTVKFNCWIGESVKVPTL